MKTGRNFQFHLESSSTNYYSENMIHHIINLNHLLIITNINSIVIIKKHKKILKEMIKIKKIRYMWC